MCQIHEYRKKTSNVYSIYNFAIQLLPINVGKQFFSQKQLFFNGTSLSGDHTIDFEIKTEKPSAVAGNKSILTTLSNYNSLQKSPSYCLK